ncbi:hypothetical protein AGMMS4956_19220 [Bacteroidia bacterium]|nr:hypothetical protein AGMMS4956_19220 [Bacteroidia bacterium]
MNTTTLAQPASTYRPLAETWNPTIATPDYMRNEVFCVASHKTLEKHTLTPEGWEDGLTSAEFLCEVKKMLQKKFNDRNKVSQGRIFDYLRNRKTEAEPHTNGGGGLKSQIFITAGKRSAACGLYRLIGNFFTQWTMIIHYFI